jgi:hypothetical protein
MKMDEAYVSEGQKIYSSLEQLGQTTVKEDLSALSSHLADAVSLAAELAGIAREQADRLFGSQPINLTKSETADAPRPTIMNQVYFLEQHLNAIHQQLNRF